VLGLDALGVLAVLGDRDRPVAVEPAMAVEHPDLVLFEQMGDAAVELAGHVARAFDHLVEIVAYVLGFEAEIAKVVHQPVDLG
jgi:hypothetical protein